MQNKNGAVCVVYNPIVEDYIDNLKHYVSFFDELVVVDNSNDINHTLTQELGVFKNVSYVPLRKNEGIGYAQNIGISHLSDFIDKICFFDQDSWVSKEDLEKVTTFLSVGPTYGLLALSTEETIQVEENKIIEVNEVISSGSIILREVFEQLGKFDEDLFIDFVDYEFCWRMRKAGYRIGIVAGTQLVHQVNSAQVHKHTISAPFRNYYSFRNAIILLKQRRVFKRKTYVINLLIKRVVFEIFFNSKRLSRVRFICRGISDGIREKGGELID